jgi:glycosyltransferase involved in cell wall biosynthesis
MLRHVGKIELYSDIDEARLDLLMRNAEALIMTSRFESFGLVVLEAATFSTGTIFVGPPEITEVLPETSGGSRFFANTRALTEFLNHEPPLVDFKVLGAKANEYTSNSLSYDFVRLEWQDFFKCISKK